ncbi:MAG: hypothetical protein RLZZ175_1040 [Bacteroidota bacterium]|jgi:hypothetical protein
MTPKKESIEQTFNQYFQAIALNNNALVLEYIHPKVFDLVPKHAMLATMNQFSEDNQSISIKKHKIKDISKIIENDGFSFAFVKYQYKIQVQFKAESADEIEAKEFTIAMLKAQYGKSNVELDKNLNLLTAKVKKSMFAVYNESWFSWKLIENKPSMKDILNEIIPKKIIKKLC